jgi:predicted site-specific integrase-resolvase
MSDSNLFKTKDAASYIGYSAGTLYNWRVTGEGPIFIKPRMKVLYRKEDLDEWLEHKGKCKTAAQARVKRCRA